jgi:hypothetical protein
MRWRLVVGLALAGLLGGGASADAEDDFQVWGNTEFVKTWGFRWELFTAQRGAHSRRREQACLP